MLALRSYLVFIYLVDKYKSVRRSHDATPVAVKLHPHVPGELLDVFGLVENREAYERKTAKELEKTNCFSCTVSVRSLGDLCGSDEFNTLVFCERDKSRKAEFRYSSRSKPSVAVEMLTELKGSHIE